MRKSKVAVLRVMKGDEAVEIQLLALELGGKNPRTPPYGGQPPPPHRVCHLFSVL